MESLWSIINFVGPLLLIAAIIWAVMRNRGGSRREIEQAEQGARDLREELANDEARREER